MHKICTCPSLVMPYTLFFDNYYLNHWHANLVCVKVTFTGTSVLSICVMYFSFIIIVCASLFKHCAQNLKQQPKLFSLMLYRIYHASLYKTICQTFYSLVTVFHADSVEHQPLNGSIVVPLLKVNAKNACKNIASSKLIYSWENKKFQIKRVFKNFRQNTAQRSFEN